LVELVGIEKYNEEIKILEKINNQEMQNGKFESIVGDVDKRKDTNPGLLLPALCRGFETQCGIKGGKLSGGQKQRVAIARTVIRQPKVLLLDEATSALDEDSQKQVQKALEQTKAGRTTIVIAHRLTTIEKCDKIFVLENGKVVEEGGFSELKQKGGFFSKLAKG
jgi:ABC-type multidrug transport system fused ATPase/permease subunit